jgi:hypothetical protein
MQALFSFSKKKEKEMHERKIDTSLFLLPPSLSPVLFLSGSLRAP